jgi:hypothetical protein
MLYRARRDRCAGGSALGNQRVAHRNREAAGEPLPEPASEGAHEPDFNGAVTAPSRREGSANPLSTLNA